MDTLPSRPLSTKEEPKGQHLFTASDKNIPNQPVAVNVDISENDEINIMASVQEIKQFFVKDVLIVWYSPDALSELTQDYADMLQEICEIKVFYSWEEATTFIEAGKADCIVISSERELFVKGINGKLNVFSINIFCADVNLQTGWAKNYDKVDSVQSDFQALLTKVKQQMAAWKKDYSLRLDFPVFSPIFDDYDKSDNNYLKLYLIELSKFVNREQSKLDLLTLARAIYDDTRNLKDFEKDYNDFDLKKIFTWYTKESFLYKVTNNCLRLAKPDTIYYCRLIIKDLEIAIKQQYQQKSKDFHGVLYRAACISDEDWNRLEQNRGKDIEMHGFLSTTKNKNVAESFAQEHRDQKALITIIVPPILDQEPCQGFAEVSDYSLYSVEDEMLFNIRSRFTILETTFEEIDKVKYRHLVLLYGAHGISKLVRQKKPRYRVTLDNIDCIKCRFCGLESQAYQKLMFFISLRNGGGAVCIDCVKNSNILDIPALVSISNLPIDTIEVPGLLMNYKEKLNIPFYGYRCKKCQNINIKQKFICQSCAEQENEWCDACFSGDQECVGSDHLIIVENQPFTFWSQKMDEAEFAYLKYKFGVENQGDIFMNALDFEKAARYYEKRLTIHEDKKDLIAANLCNSAGIAYDFMGQFERAKKLYLEAFEIRKSIHGENHQDIADSYTSLGVIYSHLSQYKEALRYHFAALEIRKAIFGEKHHFTAPSYGYLGIVHYYLGQSERSVEYYLQALEIYNVAFGKNHPVTAGVCNNLASVYRDLEQFDKAMKYNLDGLKVFKSLYGDKWIGSAVSYAGMGSTYLKLGKFEKALEYNLNALKILKGIFGEVHPNIAKCYDNLGLVYFQQGEFDKAKKHYLDSMEMKKRIYGECDSELIDTYNHLGLLYQELSEFQTAIQYHASAFNLCKSIYGDSHPDIGISNNNLGLACCRLGNFEKAIEFSLNALNILRTFYGDNHSYIATIYNNLGSANFHLAQSDKAIDYYLKSLEITKSVYGEQHGDTARTYENLGFVYQQMGQFNKSLEYYLVVLDTKKALFGDKHAMLANSYSNLGSVYMSLQLYEEAIGHYKSTLDMCRLGHGENHPDTAQTYNNLGAAYSQSKQFLEAVKCHKNALTIFNSLYGGKNQCTIDSYNALKVALSSSKQLRAEEAGNKPGN